MIGDFTERFGRPAFWTTTITLVLLLCFTGNILKSGVDAREAARVDATTQARQSAQAEVDQRAASVSATRTAEVVATAQEVERSKVALTATAQYERNYPFNATSTAIEKERLAAISIDQVLAEGCCILIIRITGSAVGKYTVLTDSGRPPARAKDDFTSGTPIQIAVGHDWIGRVEIAAPSCNTIRTPLLGRGFTLADQIISMCK